MKHRAPATTASRIGDGLEIALAPIWMWPGLVSRVFGRTPRPETVTGAAAIPAADDDRQPTDG